MSFINCFASGWNDYSLEIGDGYSIFRANSMDVCIGNVHGNIILHPDIAESVGPVSKYMTTKTHIFTKNLGRIPRNLFEGDTFEKIDPSKEFFFMIIKKTDRVVGPFSKEEFNSQKEVKELEYLDWKTPKNPNVGLPIYGSLMFILISIPILMIKFFWITIPFFIGLILFIKYIKKRRQKKTNINPEKALIETELTSQKNSQSIEFNKKNIIILMLVSFIVIGFVYSIYVDSNEAFEQRINKYKKMGINELALYLSDQNTEAEQINPITRHTGTKAENNKIYFYREIEFNRITKDIVELEDNETQKIEMSAQLKREMCDSPTYNIFYNKGGKLIYVYHLKEDEKKNFLFDVRIDKEFCL